MTFASMDVFMGAEITEATMRFRETSPVNDNFELFGMEDKNFMMNSGSYFVIQIGLCTYFVGKWLINLVCRKFAKYETARLVGIWAYQAKVGT